MNMQQFPIASPQDKPPPPVKDLVFITRRMKMMQHQSPLHDSLNHTHAFTTRDHQLKLESVLLSSKYYIF